MCTSALQMKSHRAVPSLSPWPWGLDLHSTHAPSHPGSKALSRQLKRQSYFCYGINHPQM
jgi:hypothetical protein